MSESTPLDDDWAPILDEGDEVERFKWGWNAETEEAIVWPVGGPGDGLPSHSTYLATAWGREPETAKGDVMGLAVQEPAAPEGSNKLLVQAYFGAEVPASVLTSFAAAFPDAVIAVVPPMQGAFNP